MALDTSQKDETEENEEIPREEKDAEGRFIPFSLMVSARPVLGAEGSSKFVGASFVPLARTEGLFLGACGILGMWKSFIPRCHHPKNLYIEESDSA